MTDPDRIPDDIALPEPLDFAYQVFSTDPRVMDYAGRKFQVPKDDAENGNVLLKKAVLRIWHIAKNAPRLARHRKGRASCPEQAWYDDARILGERVGKRWETTPIPTLVEALKDDELLHALAFPRVTLKPGQQANVITQPQVCFRGRRLVLGDEWESSRLVIHDIRVGNCSQHANSCALFGGCFSNVAFPSRLKLDTAQAGQCIRLLLENVDEVRDVTVSPTLFGIMLVLG